jgi:hypothetical protein
LSVVGSAAEADSAAQTLGRNIKPIGKQSFDQKRLDFSPRSGHGHIDNSL